MKNVLTFYLSRLLGATLLRPMVVPEEWSVAYGRGMILVVYHSDGCLLEKLIECAVA